MPRTQTSCVRRHVTIRLVRMTSKTAIRTVCVLALLACAGGASAQFGHPLKGSWSGDWGSDKQHRTHVLLDLGWDGKTIAGTINPGPTGVPLKSASLDAEHWTVRFEADGKDASGKVVHYLIEGKVENLGAYSRVISGMWTQGEAKGDFRITRN